MNDNVKCIFNLVAEKYDKERRELIPLFDVYYGTAVQILNLENTKGKILDLGAGTGLLTSMIMKKYNDAHYTLIDIADEMLTIARKRFEGVNNVTYLVDDYRKGIVGGKYDAIVSGMSIHHLDFKEKENLYKDIYNSLEDNGVFINVDQVKGEDEESENIIKGYQLNHIENSILSREAKGRTYNRLELDKMDKYSDQEKMLRQAGFKSVDVYYKYYNYIVFKASK